MTFLLPNEALAGARHIFVKEGPRGENRAIINDKQEGRDEREKAGLECVV